jgi:hypothetical protein
MLLMGDGLPQDYAEAARWFRLAAEQGNSWAQCNLGTLYAEGHGVPKAWREAVKWWRLAADQGHVTSQFNLGNWYSNQGRDLKTAAEYYRQAAEQGHERAAEALRLAADEGEVWAELNFAKLQVNAGNYQHALKWFRRAARKGNPNACGNLGLLYFRGQGVKQNYAYASAWLNLAVRHGLEEAEQIRDQTGERLAAADIDRATREIQRWLEQRPLSGFP